MNIEQKSQIQLEILISTMGRSNLGFLNSMFRNSNIRDHNVLIINQTNAANLLYSKHQNIRVINSYDKGLSKSRNLAIESAIGEICLIADDDVVFVADFEKKIIQAYHENESADVLTFKTITSEGGLYWNYPLHKTEIKPYLEKILSIEVSFKRKPIQEGNYRFDEHFGLGAEFQDSETFLFLRKAVAKNKLRSLFVPEFIVEHEPESSSDDVSSDRFIYARSALNYKLFGSLSYFYVFKLLFSLLRKGKISFGQLFPKYKVARQSIKRYKTITDAS